MGRRRIVSETIANVKAQISFEEKKPADLFDEYKVLKEKRMALEEEKESRGLSKSKSAYLAQVKLMEREAKNRALAEKQRLKERAADQAARAADREAAVSGVSSGNDGLDKFNKISPIKVGLPSLPF